MIQDQALQLQASIYIYDLKNSALENGFKADETWELAKATQEDMAAIELQYYPTISIRVFPETLTELFGLVKAKLSTGNVAGKTTEADLKVDKNLQFLVAFNPNRPRH